MRQRLSKLLKFNIAGISIKVYLLLAIICCIGYWPVSFEIFSLKNDAVRYFLPYRYNISNAIQMAQFPFWSPYVYTGFPLHGDMQSGLWNPVVLLLSLITRYNLSVLHFESLLYIFLAGVGMFKLLGELGIHNRVKLLVSVSYMFCGFITDSGQFIVWLASAAFVPFVFAYYYRLLYNPGFGNAIKTVVALYFLLTAGYPSILIYCGYILVAAFIVRTLSLINHSSDRAFWNNFLVWNAATIIAFICVAYPAIISYIELLPLYSRAAGVSLTEALTNPFSPICASSFLFPFSVASNDREFFTDVTMRNSYVGIITISFFLSLFKMRLNGMQKFVLAVTLFSFLFSLGDSTPIRKWCYEILPLMNYFRHPANMRLFTSVGILVLAAFAMHNFWTQPLRENKKYVVGGSFLVLLTIIVLVLLNFKESNLLSDLSTFFSSKPELLTFREQLKSIFGSFTFSKAIVLQGIIQVALISVFITVLQIRNVTAHNFISILIIVDVLGNAQLSLPSTFVSKEPPEKINHFIAQYPDGFPLPDLTSSLNEKTKDELLYDPLVFGHAALYSKKIKIIDDVYSPCTLNSLGDFLNNKRIREILATYPLLYFSDSIVQYKDTLARFNIDSAKRYVFLEENLSIKDLPESRQDSINVRRFNSNVFSFQLATSHHAYANLFQNYNKNWKAYLDGRPTAILRSNITFMSVFIPSGNHHLEFRYEPGAVYIGMVVSVITILILFVFFLIKKQPDKSRNHAG